MDRNFQSSRKRFDLVKDRQGVRRVESNGALVQASSGTSRTTKYLLGRDSVAIQPCEVGKYMRFPAGKMLSQQNPVTSRFFEIVRISASQSLQIR